MKVNLRKLLSVCLALLMFVSSCNVVAYAGSLSDIFNGFYVAIQDNDVTEKAEEAQEPEENETQETTEKTDEEEKLETTEEVVIEVEEETTVKASSKAADVKATASVELAGAGTEASPYFIYTEEDLIAVALGNVDNAYKACYLLKEDIELTADTWTPIGATDSTAFQGVFDGDGHTISSTILFQSTGMSGVFGVNKGTIKNLNVNVTIADVATTTGALVATNYGTIENCYSAGSISATGSYNIGGLVGYNTGKITMSGSSVVVTASNSTVGGLVGMNCNNGTVQYSYATGDVTGKNVGGLIGEQYSQNSGTASKTLYCYSLGKVTGSGKAGGLIGYTHNYKTSISDDGSTYVEYCYAKGVVASGSSTGGLVGGTEGSYNYFKFCYYNKTNTGNRIGFGISISDLKKQNEFYGWNFDNIWAISSDKNGGYPYIDIRGEEEIVISGIGSQLDPYIIENEEQLYYLSARKLSNSMSAYYVLKNDITVTANFWTPIARYSTFTGSFDGNGHTIYGIKISNTDFGNCGLFDNNSGTIKNLTVSDVTIVGNTNTGALVGKNSGTISNCFVKDSSVSNASENYVGGMVGYNTGKITESGVECDVESSSATVGGLVGISLNNGVVQYSYASGDITGKTAGGLIGEQYSQNSGTVTRTLNSYSLGKVTGSSKAGGLIGYNHNYKTSISDVGATSVLYCYARGLVAGSGSTGGLIGGVDGSYNVVRYCYYNQANTGNKIGFSTSASSLKNPDTLYGWDFDNIWTIETDVNSGYPIVKLRGETPTVVLEGSGDEDDPYLIHNEEELWTLVLDKGDYKLSIKNHYKLANDIEVTAAHWTPIGNNGTNSFAGTFDGDGHTISGIKLSNNYYGYIGLFGYNTGTIKNLNVEATLEGVTYAGCLVAYNTGKISNCSSSGSVYIAGSSYAGGLVGYNTGTVELSNSSATVGNSDDIAGGLLGMSFNNGVVQYCYATGNVTGKYAGGLIGEQYSQNSGTVTRTLNSYSLGKVTGSSKAGGLIGYTHNYKTSISDDGSTSVLYCYARGLVAGSGSTGGLIGGVEGSYNIIRYCYYNEANTGNKMGFRVPVTTMYDKDTFYMWNFDNIWAISKDVNGGTPYINLRGKIEKYELDGYGDADDPYLIYTERDLWALVDGTYNLNAKLYYQLQNDIEITANYWTPIGSNGYAEFNGVFDGNGYTISGIKFSKNFYDFVGLFGVNNGTIKNLNVEAILESVTYAGCIVSYNKGKISNCSSSGKVYIAGSGYAGGLVGYNTGTVEYSKSSAIVGDGDDTAGGLLGMSLNNGVVQYCYATGNVTGKIAGGLIGEQYSQNSGTATKTLNSYSKGEVTGSDKVGGLIGYTHNYKTSISDDGSTYVQYCYSNSKVGGSGTKGGLVGAVNGSHNTVTSSYYNTTLSEMTDINRGTPLDDNAMKLQASYVGWDYDNIWSIDAETNGGYPYIWTMQPQDTINVTGVTLDCTEKTLQVSDVTTLIATVEPSNALNKTLLWSTSNADVAYVKNGVVTACTAGTAIITVQTADGSFTATCAITVTEEVVPVVNVESVSLDKASLSVAVGSTAKLNATVLPANATNKNVTWSSSNSSVATVDAAGNIKGLKAGNVVITVKTVDGSKTATCKVTVVNEVVTVKVTGVELDKTTLSMNKGDTATLKATVSPETATNKAVSWSSSDTKVATVSDGVVTAVKAGTAVIIVTTADGGKTAICTVTVAEKETEPEQPEPDDPITETDSYIEVSSVKARAGQSFELTVSFMNNPGINTFSLGIDYDNTKLNLDGVRLCDGVPGQLEYAKKAVWLNNTDTDYSGAYLVLSFTVLEDTEKCYTDVTVRYSAGDICNRDEDDVNFKIKKGTVNIIDYISGDINGDNVVNNKDLNRLMKYLAGDDVVVNEAALDVNGDGNVNNKDLNRLMKYLAGDDVVIY